MEETKIIDIPTAIAERDKLVAGEYEPGSRDPEDWRYYQGQIDLLNDLSSQPSFVAVIHCWFVNSLGFRVKELQAKTFEEAEDEADLLCHRAGGDFRHSAVTVIELQRGERLPRPRVAGDRLSIWERITGRIWSE